MIIETTPEDYIDLIAGRAPRGLKLADSPIANQNVLQMLADVAAKVRECFSPASWLIAEDGEIVGLCSVTRPPSDGGIDVGYGIAPTRQGQGITGRAIGEIAAWAMHDPRLSHISAETAVGNLASQRVLERNGFLRIGERVDDEDGPLLCWRLDCG